MFFNPSLAGFSAGTKASETESTLWYQSYIRHRRRNTWVSLHISSLDCVKSLSMNIRWGFSFSFKKRALLLTLRTKVQNMNLYICNSQGHPNVHMLNSVTLHKEHFGKHMKQYQGGLWGLIEKYCLCKCLGSVWLFYLQSKNLNRVIVCWAKIWF